MTNIKPNKLLPLQEPKAQLSLSEAYGELTMIEFAAWVRLMECQPDELEHRGRVAKILRRSQRQSDAILLSLSHKGYVEIISTIGLPTRFQLLRRAMINPRTSSFVRLSDVASDDGGSLSVEHRVVIHYRTSERAQNGAPVVGVDADEVSTT